MVIERREMDLSQVITPYGMNIFSALLPNYQLLFFLKLKEKGYEYEKILKQKLSDLMKENIEEKLPIILLDCGVIIGASITRENIMQGKDRMDSLVIKECGMNATDIQCALKIFNENELDYLLWWFLTAFSVKYQLVVQECGKLHKRSKTIFVSNNRIYKRIPVTQKAIHIFMKKYDVRGDEGRLKDSDAWTFQIDILNVNKFGLTDFSQSSNAYRYIINMIFNYNSVYMLNYGKPYKYRQYLKKLGLYKKNICKRHFHMDDFVIDSSGILGLYGVRMPTDINYLSTASDAKRAEYKYIRSHMHVANTYEKSILEIVTLPENYLYFNDIKFMAPDIVLKACMNRKELSKKIDGIFLSYITKRWILDREHRRFLSILKIIHYINRKKRETRKMIKYCVYILEGKYNEAYHIWYG